MTRQNCCLASIKLRQKKNPARSSVALGLAAITATYRAAGDQVFSVVVQDEFLARAGGELRLVEFDGDVGFAQIGHPAGLWGAV
jgi:hypothetical protein